MPEDSIVSDEMISAAEAILQNLATARPFTHLPITGGSIGQGLPVAVGAAVACPDRKVIALQADGSAMYTLQSLWTMARERLDIVVVILANRRYRILEIETRRTGAGEIGPRANDMMDLTPPGSRLGEVGRRTGSPGRPRGYRGRVHRAVPRRRKPTGSKADRGGARVTNAPHPLKGTLYEIPGSPTFRIARLDWKRGKRDRMDDADHGRS